AADSTSSTREEVMIVDTSMGLMKALHNILTEPQRTKVKPKFKYVQQGSTTRATRCLRKHERSQLTELVRQLAILDPQTQHGEIQEIMRPLSGQPIAFFPIKQEIRIDYSKTYP